MVEQLLQKPEIDPVNGLEVVWRSDPDGNRQFSLVKAPIDTPLFISYGKKGSGTDISIIPKNIDWWFFRGRTNYPVLRNLLPKRILIKKHAGNVAYPGPSEFNFKKLSELGDIGFSEEGHLLVNFLVPTRWIGDLLYASWTPYGKKVGDGTPPFSLGEGKDVFRILPQKSSKDRRDKSLVVRLY